MTNRVDLPPRRQRHIVSNAKVVLLACHEPPHRGREDPRGANNGAYFHSQW